MLTNVETKFEAAVNGVRARGVHLAVNVMTCCRSCTTGLDVGLPSDEAAKTTPNAFHYGGQDNELVWRNGQPFYRDEPWSDGDEDEDGFSGSRRHQKREERCAHVVYFNHGGPDLTAAQTLVEVFRGEGFEVEWDGTKYGAVVVNLV
jgi:hypothetical protein